MFRRFPRWIRYCASLLVPVAVLAFLVTVPHGWPGWLAVPAVLLAITLRDRVGGGSASPMVPGRTPGALLILVAAGALHLGNAIVLAATARGMGLVDFALALLLVGIGTAYAAGIVGHELVHRSSRVARLGGRLLLWPALYDHFSVEHVKGHHVHVATLADPTTARYGETFVAFAVRSAVGQLVSAWRIDRRAVVLGFAAQALLFVAIAMTFGRMAFVAWVLQALVATVIITAVNYFDHWGLQRSGRRFAPEDAWDCEGALSHYVLLALPHHPDHHLHAARQFDRLAATHASPKLPHGYVRMVLLVLFANRSARRMLSRELQARQLGPFRTTRASAA